ncbi:helix-turn-helix domain-containing protein [Comamonas sp.]|uniref:helix-turn-helix domain-containing protein n=1 Tax=Comamonas sp. TaxID=34028 RepID=UPI002FC65C5D
MQTATMNQSPLNQALADNLARLMDMKGLKQMALAKKCGVAQTTISLYLNPDRRKPGKDGKPGSAKLTEVEMLASALGVESWELLRPMTGAQREVYERIEAAYRALQPKQPENIAAPVDPTYKVAPKRKRERVESAS